MVSRMKKMWIQHHETILYVIFGLLTTLLNWIIYYILYNILSVSAAFSNVFAWVVAVFFAFWTNKLYVFKKHNVSSKNLILDMLKFIACRLASGSIETVLLYYAVDYRKMDGNIWKLFVSLLVVVLNYIGSKFLVFKTKNGETN